MFMSIEGIEGCGKTTLTQALAERLREQGRAVVTLREPGGTQLGDAVRALFLDGALSIDPRAELMLVNASRAQLVREVIRPLCERGTADILCDRYVDSTLAYQGYGRGLDLAEVRQVCEVATGGLLPDLTFVLDLDVATSAWRLRTRGQAIDRMESQDAVFHERVRQGFLSLARAQTERVLVLDATLDVAVLCDLALTALDMKRAAH